MATIQNLTLSYSQWKSIRASISVPTYYFVSPTQYTLVLVDLTRGFTYNTKLIHNPNAEININTLDFVANIKPSSILQSDYDSCIAAAIIG